MIDVHKKMLIKIDILAQQVFKPNSLFIRKLYKKTNPGRPFLLLAADLHQNISKKLRKSKTSVVLLPEKLKN